MYYIKIIEEFCWVKYLFLNIFCVYLDYMIFWFIIEKDIKKRFCYYFKIINNKNLGSFGLWVKYLDNIG